MAERRAMFQAAAVALGGYFAVQATVVSSGFAGKYLAWEIDAQQFTFEMHASVYRSRIIGSILDLSLAHLVGGPFTAELLVNGAVVAVVAALMWQRMNGRGGPWMAVVAFLLGSGCVVTPYDYLSYLAITVVFIAAIDRPEDWTLACAAMVVGMAIRESVILVVPALIATGAPRRLWVGIGAAGVVTYGLIHRLTAGASVVPQPLSINTRPDHLIGLFAALVGVLVVQIALRDASGGQRALVWLLAAPYFVVIVWAGSWLEAGRLLAPLVLCDALVATRIVADPGADSAGPDLHQRQSVVRVSRSA